MHAKRCNFQITTIVYALDSISCIYAWHPYPQIYLYEYNGTIERILYYYILGERGDFQNCEKNINYVIREDSEFDIRLHIS
jgi:hypothetical protein